MFSELGDEYAKVSAGPGTSFEVVKDDNHDVLLGILKAANIVKPEKVRLQDRYKVEVLSHV